MHIKHLLFLLSFSLIVTAASAQWSNRSFSFDGKNRQFRVYVPSSYNASNPASLVFTLHGLGDNMNNFSGIGMNHVADTANIIVVVPQALADPLAGNAWNSGAGFLGYYPNSNVDDVGFISALIDTISAQYTINPQNVFCCGFSMGGFMTEKLACQLSTRIRSFASVAGTFGGALTCDPWRPVCVAHFHGTGDATVPYTGGDYGVSADSVINFWVGKNQCNTTPQIDSLPDTQNDGMRVTRYEYSGGNENTSVLHFKVDSAAHTWLTAANDISYTVEIWNFFRTCGGVLTGVETVEHKNEVEVYPNPANDFITVKLGAYQSAKHYKLSITDNLGRTVYAADLKNEINRVDLKKQGIAEGLYVVKVQEGSNVYTSKVVVKN